MVLYKCAEWGVGNQEHVFGGFPALVCACSSRGGRASWRVRWGCFLVLVSFLLCLFEIFYNKKFENSNNNRKIYKSPFLTLDNSWLAHIFISIPAYCSLRLGNFSRSFCHLGSTLFENINTLHIAHTWSTGTQTLETSHSSSPSFFLRKFPKHRLPSLYTQIRCPEHTHGLQALAEHFSLLPFSV